MKKQQARAIWYAYRKKNMEEQKRVIEKYSSIEAFKNSKYKTMGTFIRFELGLEGYGSR